MVALENDSVNPWRMLMTGVHRVYRIMGGRTMKLSSLTLDFPYRTWSATEDEGNGLECSIHEIFVSAWALKHAF